MREEEIVEVCQETVLFYLAPMEDFEIVCGMVEAIGFDSFEPSRLLEGCMSQFHLFLFFGRLCGQSQGRKKNSIYRCLDLGLGLGLW